LAAFEPYEGKPPASGQDQNENVTINEKADGFCHVAVEKIYDHFSYANNSCRCNLCIDSKLMGAVEFRCCGKFVKHMEN